MPRETSLLHSLHPWQCTHHSGHSEITAYVEASGLWETVAVIRPTTGVSAEEFTTFIILVINATRQSQDLLREAMKALEAVMQEGLTYSTEQEADSVVASIKRAFS